MTPIVGSIVALVTPMHTDGSVDYDALRRLIDWHIAEGTDCIGVVGTTGESPTVDFDEHKDLIRVAVAHAKGRIPVIEIMMATPIVRKYILDGEFDKLKSAIGNRESGSQSFDQHLTELFTKQIIDVNEAQRLASNVDALKLALRGITNSDTRLR